MFLVACRRELLQNVFKFIFLAIELLQCLHAPDEEDDDDDADNLREILAQEFTGIRGVEHIDHQENHDGGQALPHLLAL